MISQQEARQTRGAEIAKLEGQVKRVAEGCYKVSSQRGDWDYIIQSTETGWICNCPDQTYRHVSCKHIYAVEFSQKLRQEVKASVIIAPITVSECGFCHSQNLKKFGVRKNKCGDLQRFLCADCKRTFSINLGFEKMKHDPKGVVVAMQLYFSGESLRKTSESLKLIGVQVSYRTILNWITKYVGLMDRYLDRISPQVSDVWRTDELFLKVKGNMKYLYAMMDDETRYWIAQEVAHTKYTHDVRKLFQKSKEVAGKIPKSLISDGANNFHDAYRKEFLSPYGETPSATHIRDIRFDGSVHNNKMERMNGEVRDREKTMRGLKRMDTPILKGVQIFHNYIKPHRGLGGMTPAEAAGIKVEGEDKWRTLIQNASRK